MLNGKRLPMAADHTDASLHALTPTFNPSFPTAQPIGHAIVGRPSLRASISPTTQSPWHLGMQVPIAQRAFISSMTCGRSMRPTVVSLITYYMAGSSYLLGISPVWRYFPVLVYPYHKMSIWPCGQKERPMGTS